MWSFLVVNYVQAGFLMLFSVLNRSKVWHGFYGKFSFADMDLSPDKPPPVEEPELYQS